MAKHNVNVLLYKQEIKRNLYTKRFTHLFCSSGFVTHIQYETINILKSRPKSQSKPEFILVFVIFGNFANISFCISAILALIEECENISM